MSALSEEFQAARQMLHKAAAIAATTPGREAGQLYALIGIGHALLASAGPGTAAEARNDERGLYDAQAAQD